MQTTLADALTIGRGTERPFNCPSPDHDDRHASASVNVVKGFWYCFACTASGTVEGYVPDPKDAIKALADMKKQPRIYPESWLDIFDYHHPSEYWANRYGEHIAVRYRCGTDPRTGNPTYPIRNSSGKVLGVVRRTDGTPKYEYPYGIQISRQMFMSIKPCRPDVLILVEGAADVMALDQSGLVTNWRVAGCYGAGLHYPQLQLVKAMSPKVIVAAFDDDKAGQHATERALQQCADIAPVLSVAWSSIGVTDPGEAAVDVRLDPIIETLCTSHLGRKLAVNE